jgi:hypothetical protein
MYSRAIDVFNSSGMLAAEYDRGRFILHRPKAWGTIGSEKLMAQIQFSPGDPQISAQPRPS